MMPATSFSAVYKTLGTQSIDVDIYLPASPLSRDGYMKCPVLINIHGGAFMLGSSKMVNDDQVRDCLDRGWIVLAPNHRLCPLVNLLEGPMRDCRDLLAWVYDGGLELAIKFRKEESIAVDLDHVFAMGTSSGGTLALSLGFGVPRAVAGIVDMYGPCHFSHPFWTTKLQGIAARIPPGLTEKFINKIYEETPAPIVGGVSLEGQAQGPPNFDDPRQAFALTQIAQGNVLNAIYPSQNWVDVDPLCNISSTFPPTFIIHGDADTMVPIDLSRDLYKALQASSVRCGMQEVPGEEHTFVGKMEIGTRTWELQRKGFDFLQSLVR